MKILCLADLHLGVSTYGRIDPETNLNTRVLNALNSLDETIDYAINKKIKVIAFAGDAYKNALPPSTLTSEFNKRIRRAAENGVKVLVLDGNHDVDKLETKKSPMSVFSDLAIENLYQTRFHKEVKLKIDNETVKFVFLPTYHTESEIREIVENTTYDGEPIVYLFHGTYKGAMLNDWNIAEKETYVDPAIFDREGVAAVVSGHLHKHQTVYNQPLVFYVGSTQRVDFSEEKQEKGFVVLDVKPNATVTFDFIELESQKMYTLDLDLIGDTQETDTIIEHMQMFKRKIENAIVRIRVDVDKSNSINENRVYEAAYSLGADSVLDIQKKFAKQSSVRHAELTEHVDEIKALELYYADKENGEELIQFGKEIVEKAKLEGRI